MHTRTGVQFVSGLVMGTVAGITLALIASILGKTPELTTALQLLPPPAQYFVEWIDRNLSFSVIPFSVALALYVYSLGQLSRRLDRKRPHQEIALFEHLTDIWISLFFGIGVIWTAIGMRSALLSALGDPGVIVELDAFSVLQRLVDGGILTALSTTILGGIGGYLMRIGKGLYVGPRLSRHYTMREQLQVDRIESLLIAIRAELQTTTSSSPTHPICTTSGQ